MADVSRQVTINKLAGRQEWVNICGMMICSFMNYDPNDLDDERKDYKYEDAVEGEEPPPSTARGQPKRTCPRRPNVRVPRIPKCPRRETSSERPPTQTTPRGTQTETRICI